MAEVRTGVKNSAIKQRKLFQSLLSSFGSYILLGVSAYNPITSLSSIPSPYLCSEDLCQIILLAIFEG